MCNKPEDCQDNARCWLNEVKKAATGIKLTDVMSSTYKYSGEQYKMYSGNQDFSIVQSSLICLFVLPLYPSHTLKTFSQIAVNDVYPNNDLGEEEYICHCDLGYFAVKNGTANDIYPK